MAAFRTQKMAERQEAKASANGLFANNFLRPTLDNGFTKKRTGYVAPIYLSLDVLSQHLAETIHYVTHYEAVKQADKIRSHPVFQELVTRNMGREFWAELRPWLQDVANNVTQRRYPEFGDAASRSRSCASFSGVEQSRMSPTWNHSRPGSGDGGLPKKRNS